MAQVVRGRGLYRGDFEGGRFFWCRSFETLVELLRRPLVGGKVYRLTYPTDSEHDPMISERQCC